MFQLWFLVHVYKLTDRTASYCLCYPCMEVSLVCLWAIVWIQNKESVYFLVNILWVTALKVKYNLKRKKVKYQPTVIKFGSVRPNIHINYLHQLFYFFFSSFFYYFLFKSAGLYRYCITFLVVCVCRVSRLWVTIWNRSNERVYTYFYLNT